MKVLNKNIDVIAIFDPEGKIRPWRFKYDEQDETIVVDVNRLMKREIQKIEGQTYVIFRCQSMIHGRETVYEITFNRDKLVWKLHKV